MHMNRCSLQVLPMQAAGELEAGRLGCVWRSVVRCNAAQYMAPSPLQR
jgi:hypothetical protein